MSADKKDYAEKRFRESVFKFADAFFALTDEEREELTEYTEARCAEAKEEYEQLQKKKKQNRSK